MARSSMPKRQQHRTSAPSLRSPLARFCACMVSASSAFFSRANRPATLARLLTPPACSTNLLRIKHPAQHHIPETFGKFELETLIGILSCEVL